MKTKICLVTGANSGIGYATALDLAGRGAQVGIVCRNTEKAEKTRQEIIAKTGNEQIDIFACDFSVQSQIREVAAQILAKYARIDVLVNNAGLITHQRETTTEGYEMTFAVNHLGYFMLTNLLKTILLASPEGRIVNVSSEAHRFARIDFQNLHYEKGFNSIKAYALSKLCNVLFTNELARRLEGTNLVANSLHPGAVATNFAKNANGLIKFIFKFSKPIFLTPEQGARTMIYLATDDQAAQYTGMYFDKCKPRVASAESKNVEKAAKLWEISAQLTGLEGQTF